MTRKVDFMTLIHDCDEKTAAIFAGERIWTLTDWLRIDKRLTDAMRGGSSVPTKYASELADVKRDIANASYPPTSEARNLRRRWLQGCEEGHEAPRQRVLGEALRVERHAERGLKRLFLALRLEDSPG